MPPSPPSRLLPAAEIAERNQPQENLKDSFGTELSISADTLFTQLPHSSDEDMSSMTLNHAIVPTHNNRARHAPTTFGPAATQWSAQGLLPPYGPFHDTPTFIGPAYSSPASAALDYHQNAQNTFSYNANYSGPNMYSSDCMSAFARDTQGSNFHALPRDLSASFPPASFLHYPSALQYDPSLTEASTSELMQLDDDYDLTYSSFYHPEHRSDYASPHSGTSRASTPYSTGYEEDGPIDKEQPYAQLIYRALLGAPDHTMVLRDIYDWFKLYTDKASQSETKGWQNSIRHNLSMNGAFEKVDTSPDSSIKGYMWRLTPTALREGVKSTTRYRSKVPNKRSQHRPQPLPQRQASGAKGGHATRRAATKRARDFNTHAPSTPRSDPHATSFYGYDIDDNTYAPSSSYPLSSPYLPTSPYTTRADSPYAQAPFTSRHGGKLHSQSSAMPGMAVHLVSPPRSAPNTPVMGSESFFEMSPTLSPTVDEPITPTLAGEGDVYFDGDVHGQFARFGGGL